MFSEEDMNSIVSNLSPDEMDDALDAMNDLGMKKTGNKDEEGRDEWTMTVKDKNRKK